MKTAISLPDDLHAAADALASRLGVSRSQLYATAVAEFLAKHADGNVTTRLDRVYANEPSALDIGFRRAQRRSLGSESW
jgi:metal-responsive CopG/Arc/MetJ family transcriptional regulator